MLKSSNARARTPMANNCRTTSEPMNPAPPVTSAHSSSPALTPIASRRSAYAVFASPSPRTKASRHGSRLSNPTARFHASCVNPQSLLGALPSITTRPFPPSSWSSSKKPFANDARSSSIFPDVDAVVMSARSVSTLATRNAFSALDVGSL